MRILIGCPTYERYAYIVELWVKRVKEIIEFSKDIRIDYLLVDNSKSKDYYNNLKAKNINIIKAPYFQDVRERVINSRNILRDKVLKEGYDYFFSLEQDVIPPKDIIEEFLKHKKKIVSACYSKLVKVILEEKITKQRKRAILEIALVWLNQEKRLRRANPQEVRNKGLIKVGGFGIGCVLIYKEVLEKIKFKYKKDKKAFDDMFFCGDAKKLGYDLFLDSNINVQHYNKPWDRKTV